MKRLSQSLALAALLAAAAVPAASAAPSKSPGQLCKESNNTVTVQGYAGAVKVFEGPLQIPSAGGCASTVARAGGLVVRADLGAHTTSLSTAAFNAQCKALEAEFAAMPGGTTFFESVFGKNRASCIATLRGFHTGALTPA